MNETQVYYGIALGNHDEEVLLLACRTAILSRPILPEEK